MPPSPNESVYDLSFDELSAKLGPGQAPFRARQVWDGLHRRAQRPSEMTELPAALRDRLEQDLPPALREATRSVSDGGDTIKWLWSLAGGAAIETVLMHYKDRSTVCVSSQAGCAMACGFCATGQAGFRRQLTSGEIVEQVVVAIREARPRRVSNVVFMGMGEPLANYDRLWAAIERLHDPIGLSARHLTVSTVGVVPGIVRLAGETLPVNLAVSLHAADDELRYSLVPLNRRYRLAALIEACEVYRTAKGRRLSLEWALIDGVNDRGSDARELAAVAKRLGAHVNLIPLNPTPGFAVRGTPAEGVGDFRAGSPTSASTPPCATPGPRTSMPLAASWQPGISQHLLRLLSGQGSAQLPHCSYGTPHPPPVARPLPAADAVHGHPAAVHQCRLRVHRPPELRRRRHRHSRTPVRPRAGGRGRGIANEKRLGYYLGVVVAILPLLLIPKYGSGGILNLLFTVALIALLLTARAASTRRSGSDSPSAGPGAVMTTIDGIDGLRAAVGSSLGTSEWHEVTQAQVDLFADATGDDQWIHVDPERARQGPFGGPIAHGYLTLSLAPVLLFEAVQVDGVALVVNYGLNKVRFPAPVPVGTKVRMVVGLAGVEDVPGGVQVALDLTFELEGGAKPACVAQALFRYLV